MSEFKPGDRIEVSNNNVNWIEYTYRGMFEGWVMVEAVGPPRPFKFARPIVPKYRTPTIADYGKQCEFWDFDASLTSTRKLRGIIPELEYSFVACNGLKFRNARIKVE